MVWSGTVPPFLDHELPIVWSYVYQLCAPWGFTFQTETAIDQLNLEPAQPWPAGKSIPY